MPVTNACSRVRTASLNTIESGLTCFFRATVLNWGSVIISHTLIFGLGESECAVRRLGCICRGPLFRRFQTHSKCHNLLQKKPAGS